MKNLFEEKAAQEAIARINKLNASTAPRWGKMSAAQMLAHCCVAYDFVYEEAKYPKPNGFVRLLLKLFVKDTVVGEKPYKRNSRTAPEFIIADDRNFEVEKKRLIDHIIRTQQLGENHFHNKESRSFGPLTKTEWNIMFSKHLDHHLTQFGV